MRWEVFAYALLILGSLGDCFSTVAALAYPHIYESNTFVVQLMACGLWLPVNLVLVILGIVVPYLIIRISKNEVYTVILVYPFVFGLIRLGVSIWNVSLIM